MIIIITLSTTLGSLADGKNRTSLEGLLSLVAFEVMLVSLEAQESPPEVNGSEVQYDYEFNAIKPQLQEWYDKKIITEDTKFYYWANDGFKYSVKSFDEFINLSGDDLILLGRSASKLSGVFKCEERVAMLQSLRDQIKEEMKTGFFNQK